MAALAPESWSRNTCIGERGIKRGWHASGRVRWVSRLMITASIAALGAALSSPRSRTEEKNARVQLALEKRDEASGVNVRRQSKYVWVCLGGSLCRVCRLRVHGRPEAQSAGNPPDRRAIRARLCMIFRFSGSDIGRGADCRCPDTIQRIESGDRKSAPQPKLAQQKSREIAQIRALRAF